MGRHVHAFQRSNSCPEPCSPHLARPGQSGVVISATQRFVGLDVALRSTGERGALAHADFGIATLVERLQAVQPILIVLKTTGGSQRVVVAALAAAGLPVALVNPRQLRVMS